MYLTHAQKEKAKMQVMAFVAGLNKGFDFEHKDEIFYVACKPNSLGYNIVIQFRLENAIVAEEDMMMELNNHSDLCYINLISFILSISKQLLK
jgi:hypothetical protein